ncbi:MAG: DeoR/GlpR family DNA-binding transcription regulator [Clostridia bacterium]|nr:DeoR/GlpR family DNA-binding transcription regulator [Clostridia bacterium]
MIERRDALRAYIDEHGAASTEELCALFPNRSPMTIRRDLGHLARTGAIARTHGGARALRHGDGQHESFYYERESDNPTLKHRLATLAIPFVEARRSLFIDSGSTTMAFAQLLPDKDLTILTSAPNIALAIATQKPACSVLLTGGAVNRNTLSCSGYGSAEILQSLNIDIAFMGASGFSEAGGFTAGEHAECILKRLVLNKAGRIILLMDSSKIGKNMPYTFARPTEIHILLTDTGLPASIEARLHGEGVQVIKAER